MNSKLIKSLLLAGAVGFFLLWFLEFRRTSLADSYWLMLLCLTCLLGFQYYRLRQAAAAAATPAKPRAATAACTSKKGQPAKRRSR
jgi:hypothetical protein